MRTILPVLLLLIPIMIDIANAQNIRGDNGLNIRSGHETFNSLRSSSPEFAPNRAKGPSTGIGGFCFTPNKGRIADKVYASNFNQTVFPVNSSQYDHNEI